MMCLKTVILAAAVVGLSGVVHGAETRIENPFLQVLVETDSGLMSCKCRSNGLAFVNKLRLPQAVLKTTVVSAKPTVWGAGKTIHVDHPGGWTTDVSIYDESPFVHIERTITNRGSKPFEVNAFEYLDFQVDLGVAQEKLAVLGTGGLTSVEKCLGSYAFSAIADPDTRHGMVCGWLTHKQGVGVFFPSQEAEKICVKAQIDFGHLQVDPGGSRATETLLIGYFDDARRGLESYADAIVRNEDIRLADKPGVYCTWYHAGASDEKRVVENAEFAAGNLKPFGLSVIQIDDRWQAILPRGFSHDGKIETTGPIKVFVDTQPNYSKGMAHTAKQITTRGMVAGIWFMPFAGNFRNPYFDPEIFAKNPDGTPFHDARWSGTCIDMTNPKAERFVRDRVRRLYDWGFRYFKIDGMHTGAITYNTYVNTSYGNKDFGKALLHDPRKTHVEAYRKGLRVLRQEAPGTFILGCNVSQNMRSMGPAFGMIDGMRIGPDNGGAARGAWNAVVKGAWHGTNLYFLNGKVWHNDPDPVYPRESNPIERARWMCSWMAVAGAMHTSSEQYSTLPPDRLDLLRRCLPSHNLLARPVDLFETNNPRIWHVQNDRIHLLGLFNWSETDADEITYRLDRLGLDGAKTYVAFEYWSNEFLKPMQDQLCRTISPASCQVLAVRELADHPVLVSTSRHITQGLMDVKVEKWNAATKTLSGTSTVVGNDPYELRFAFPAGGEWNIARVELSETSRNAGAKVNIQECTSDHARVVIETGASGLVSWSVAFE